MPALTKSCTKCGKEKLTEEFSRDRCKRDGRQARCRACKNTYYAANSERMLGQARAWRESNPERARESARARRESNPERTRAEDWASNYRQRSKAYGHTPVVEEFTYADVIEAYGDACAHCPEGEFEHLDHYPVPVALGGHHSLENVKPSCAPCNQAESRAVRTARAEAIAA